MADIHTAIEEAWEEHLQRVRDKRPYEDGLTVDDLEAKVQELREKAAKQR